MLGCLVQTMTVTQGLPLSFLTLNTNKLACLGGLANLLPSLPSSPSIISLQEFTLPPRQLATMAAALGYDALIGTVAQRPAGRRLVSLVKKPTS